MKTVDGRKVIFYAEYPEQVFSKHGAYCFDGCWFPMSWTKEGLSPGSDRHLDLAKHWVINASIDVSFLFDKEHLADQAVKQLSEFGEVTKTFEFVDD